MPATLTIPTLPPAGRATRQPYKVLHILHALRFSGAEVMLRIAAPTFRERGMELHILSDCPPAESDYAEALVAAGYTVHYLPCPPGGRPRVGMLWQFLQKQGFAVVHNHTEQNFVWYCLAARLARVPHVVHTVHNSFRFAGAVRAKRAAFRWVARRWLGVRFVAISPTVQHTEQHVNLNPTTLIYNWLDLEHFRPAQSAAERAACRAALGLHPGQVVLVSVGSCQASKNHADILRALALLPPALAARTVYLHVGDGHLHAAEQALAHELALQAEVRFVGQLADVRPVLLASDVFVMPSRFEGLGMSLLEAQACALPAAVYDADGLRDLVRDHQTGRLLPPTPAALAAAIAELAADPALRQQMGQAGYQQAHQQFSLSASLRQLLQLYGIS